jgi:signal transduction histidine kinase/ActR/RegA family two-component response regulator
MPPETVKKRLLASVISAPAALTVLALVLLWHLRVEQHYSVWLEHTGRVLSQAQSARDRVLGGQAAVRGYLASANADDLAVLNRSLNDADTSFLALGAANPRDVADAARLTEIADRQRAWATAMQQLENSHTDPDSVQAAATGYDIRPRARSLLSALDGFIGAQTALMQAGLTQHQREQLLVLWVVPIAAVAVAVLLIVISWRNNEAIVREYERVLQDSEEANLKTNNFLATVSHELRNPLNLILLWSRLLLSGEQNTDKINRGLNSIDRAARTQAQLIEDLLDFAKIESGRLRLDLQPTDLPTVVNAALEAASPSAETKSIELRAVIDPRAGIILGDSQRLQQALWNLLSNAVKFTPEGGRIQVQLARINSHVELMVSDSGQGIAPSLLPHVFDRFWQAETSAQGQHKGMGLGLTIVKHIVATHGGSIRVDSEGLGRGAAFTVRLPLPTAAEGFLYQPRRHRAVVGTPELSRIPKLTGLQIIVVDDDQEATEALRGVLKSLGADPIVADCAERALQLLGEYRPDAMVSDIAMPGRDGLSLAREVREREHKAGSGHLPLVALTAYGRVEDKVKIFSAGFDSHVVKPVDPVELASVIRSVIEPNRAEL